MQQKLEMTIVEVNKIFDSLETQVKTEMKISEEKFKQIDEENKQIIAEQTVEIYLYYNYMFDYLMSMYCLLLLCIYLQIVHCLS